MDPLINILIRTTKGRGGELMDCLQSIAVQTYKNIHLIICMDDEQNFRECSDVNGPFQQLMKLLGIKTYEFFFVRPSGVKYHWNLYCNNLKERVTSGWFFYLDDDDTIRDPDSLEKMSHWLNRCMQGDGIICQFQRGNKLKPHYTAHGTFHPSEIVRGKIGGSCIFLHHSQKNVANWDGNRAADFRFIKAVSEKIPLEFVPVVVVKAGNNGRHGK